MKPIAIFWAVLSITLFTGTCIFNAYEIDYHQDECPHGFEVSVIYIVFTAFTIVTVIFMISARLKQYAIKYKHPGGTIEWLPQNYYVEETIGTDWEDLHAITDSVEFVANRSKVEPRNAASISGFCASKGSTSNKMLNTVTAWIAGTTFVLAIQFNNEIDKYAFITSGIGLLTIGMAESKYNDWAWAHVVGLFIMLGGLMTMIINEYGVINLRPIFLVVVFIIFMFFVRGNKRKGLFRAITSIVLEFIVLYSALIFATWKYIYPCSPDQSVYEFPIT